METLVCEDENLEEYALANGERVQLFKDGCDLIKLSDFGQIAV